MENSLGLIDTTMSWKGFRRLLYVLIPISALFAFGDITRWGWSLQCWDWMYYTGALTFGVAIALSIGAAQKLNTTIETLRTNNTLVLTGDEFTQIKDRMRRSARPWRIWCGVFIFALVFGTWVWALAWELDIARLGWSAIDQYRAQFGATNFNIQLGLYFIIMLVMGACGFYAGAFFGAAAGHGTFAAVLAGDDVRLRIRPDHFDGAAGLKPIGDLYLYQAFLTGFPLLWFAAWWLIIPIYDPPGCKLPNLEAWRGPMVVQWLVTLAFTYFGFIRPIFKLRARVLREQKQLQTNKAPGIKKEISRLQHQLIVAGDDQVLRDKINSKIDRLARYLWVIEQMSSWPMDAKTKRRYFSLNALVAVVPPAIQMMTKIGAVSIALPDSASLKWIKTILGVIF